MYMTGRGMPQKLTCMNVVMTLIEAIMLIVGASSAEEVGAHEMERFVWMNSHPLNINSASRRALSESGLFTDFQVVALLDYISVAGPVLSRSELAVIDGFDAEMAEALAFFVSFGAAPEQGRWHYDGRIYSGGSVAWDAVVPASGGGKSDISGVYGTDCRVSCGEKYEFGLAGAGAWSRKRTGAGVWLPVRNELSALSVSSVLSLVGNRLRLYVGDFNMRFGQGLAAWNTMTVDDPSSVNSLIRRPTGIKTSRSLTGNYAHTGLGAAFESGQLTFSAAVTAPDVKNVLLGQLNSSRGKNDVAGLQGLFNCNWWNRRFSLGFTSVVTGMPSSGHSGGGTGAETGAGTGDGTDAVQHLGSRWNCTADFSVDFRGCFGGFDLASELAGGIGQPFRAFVSAISPRLAEHFRAGASLRYSPSRHAALLVSEFSARSGHSASLSLRLRHVAPKSHEATYGNKLPGTNDFRVDARYRFRWNESSFAALRLRENVDINDPSACVFSCRSEVAVGYADIWASVASVSFSHSGKWGMVTFVEEDCRITGTLSAYLRAGLFSVDNWAGRIYVYEHDIPGRFNVPAFHGRGVWGSLYVNWKFWRRGSLAARLAYFSYPFMLSSARKPDRLEARLMLAMKF